MIEILPNTLCGTLHMEDEEEKDAVSYQTANQRSECMYKDINHAPHVV